MLKNLLLLFLYVQSAFGFPQYYCTGSNWAYYDILLNLIGSIHDSNFEQLEQIAVVDLGLTTEQVEELQRIQKVTVLPLEKTHPDIVKYLPVPHNQAVFGWYAWKPVAITQALKIFPYVLWLDAGTVVFKPLDHLFQYIHDSKYFICTIGDHKSIRGQWLHSVGWGATSHVKALFDLNNPANRWILNQETVMGGVIGVAREGQSFFLNDLYEFTKDLRNYADDGTAVTGWGGARHDQSLLSSLAYLRKLTVHKQDGIDGNPIPLQIGDQTIPFYITWSKQLVNSNTEVFNCRTDKSTHSYYHAQIRWR